MHRKPWRRLALRRAGWAAAALAAAVALCEGVLRFGLGLGNPILIQPDAACAYILKPNQSVTRFFVHTHINRYGMRSDDLAALPAPGALRLLFVGDSVTYGSSHIDQKEIFTERLHEELPAMLHRPIEVLNASASAWAPANELAYLKSRGIFQSNIVLLVLNDGDLSQPESTLAQVGDELPQHKPATAIGEVFTRYLKPRLLHMAARQDAGDDANANAGAVIRQNLANLDTMQRIITGNRARFALIYIPFSRDLQASTPSVAASAATLKTWCSAHNVPLLNLTSTEQPYPPDQITYDHGIHLNAKGHNLVAQAIEQAWPQLAEAR